MQTDVSPSRCRLLNNFFDPAACPQNPLLVTETPNPNEEAYFTVSRNSSIFRNGSPPLIPISFIEDTFLASNITFCISSKFNEVWRVGPESLQQWRHDKLQLVVKSIPNTSGLSDFRSYWIGFIAKRPSPELKSPESLTNSGGQQSCNVQFKV
jgi:hypothetical protein